VLVTVVVLAGAGGAAFIIGSREEAPPIASSGPGVGELATGTGTDERSAVVEVQRNWDVVPALPAAHRSKLELPPSSTAILPTNEVQVAEVAVEADAALWINGKQVDLDVLKEMLFIHAERSRDLDHPNQPSNVPVLITADGGVRWREIQWVMQACADPAIRMWKLNFAVTTPDGEQVVDVDLPHERELTPDKASGFTLDFDAQPKKKLQFKVELKRTASEPGTRVELTGKALGIDDFDRLASLLESLAESNPDASVELHAWAAVPFRQVIEALDQIRGVGFTEVTFIGAPPPKRVR
jgi:biopolymer transport protein ExbD